MVKSSLLLTKYLLCPTTVASLRRAHMQLIVCETHARRQSQQVCTDWTLEAGATVATSLPLLFESYGGLAPLSIVLLGQAVRAYAQIHNASMTPLEFSRRLRQRLHTVSVALQRDSQSLETEVATGSDTTVTRGVMFQIVVTGPPPPVNELESSSTESRLDSESVLDIDSNQAFCTFYLDIIQIL